MLTHMTDYIPDPFKNYVMKAPKVAEGVKPINSQSDEDALAAMGIDWEDDEALKRLSRMKLARIVATCPASPTSLPVIRELLDRLEGKPMQRIKQDTTVSFDLKANSQLLDRFKARLGVKEAIVIDNTISSS